MNDIFMIIWFASGFILSMILAIADLVRAEEDILLKDLGRMLICILFATIFGLVSCGLVLMTIVMEFFDDHSFGEKVIIKKNKKGNSNANKQQRNL
jgi:anaerobic C4-dicarboxylate transporter